MTLRTLLSALCLVPAVLSAGLGLVCLFNPHRPLLYLIDIFTLPGLSTTLVLAAILWGFRLRPASWIATGAVVLFVLAIWPQAFPRQLPADRGQPRVRMVFANMLIRNERPKKILPWITMQNPDVIAMVEVNPFARQAMMAELQHDRPYVVTRYDMVMASRYPLSNVQRGGVGFALMTATVKAPSGDITVAVAHLTRPWPFTDSGDQPRQFARLSEALKPLAGHRFILVGDFNTPPCASGLGDFMRARKLHAAGALGGTWISVLPGFLRVNIDNAMASGDLNLSRRRVGPYDGSDHRPVVVDIYPAKQR